MFDKYFILLIILFVTIQCYLHEKYDRLKDNRRVEDSGKPIYYTQLAFYAWKNLPNPPILPAPYKNNGIYVRCLRCDNYNPLRCYHGWVRENIRWKSTKDNTHITRRRKSWFKPGYYSWRSPTNSIYFMDNDRPPLAGMYCDIFVDGMCNDSDKRCIIPPNRKEQHSWFNYKEFHFVKFFIKMNEDNCNKNLRDYKVYDKNGKIIKNASITVECEVLYKAIVGAKTEKYDVKDEKEWPKGMEPYF